MCLVQTEYPTHTDLLKGQRQHWDIAVIDKNKGANGIPEYDHLHLLAAVEFGLNEGSKHLVEDIRRLAMDDNSENKYVIHLYRISNRESRRDISPDSKSRYLSQEEAQKILDSREKKEKLITIYYGIADMVGKKSNLCRIDDDGIHRLN